MSLIQINFAPQQQEMQPIGSVADLGATIETGEARVFVKDTFGGPGDPVTAGYFGITRGKFRMTYPFNEQATVVQGSVKLTDIAAGTSVTYNEGDSWFVTQGTAILWEVQCDFFIKHFFAAVDR